MGKVDPVYNYDLYHKELKFRLQVALQNARNKLERAKDRTLENQTKIYPLEVKIGDRVKLKVENRTKLDKVYSGPYIIGEINHPNCLIVDPSTQRKQLVHKNRLARY